MATPIPVAHMLISCGYMNELEATLYADGSLKISWSHLWPLVMPETLTNWTARDLLIASEYVEHRQDYSKAERGFRYVLYQRGCLPPRYPVPAPYYGKDNPQYWTFRAKFEARYRAKT